MIKVITSLLFFHILITGIADDSLFIFIDNSGELEIEELHFDQFQTYSVEKGALGLNSCTAWLWVRKDSSKAEDSYLELRNPFLEKIIRYQFQNRNWKLIEQKGSTISDQRTNREKYFYFNLSGEDELYKISSTNLSTLNASILDEYQFKFRNVGDYIVLVIFYVFMAVAFISNLKFNVNQDAAVSRYYSAYLLSNSLHVLVVTGVVFLLPIRGTLVGEYVLAFSAVFLMLTYFVFTRYMLSVSDWSFALKNVYKWSVIGFLVGTVIFTFVSKILLFRYINFVGFYLIVLSTASAIYAWKNGIEAAKYFLLGWACFLVAVTLDMLYNLGILKISFSVNYFAIAGAALESLFFTWGLSIKFKKLIKDHSEANKMISRLKSQLYEFSLQTGFNKETGQLQIEELNSFLHDQLSPREIDVLKLLVQDLTYEEIGEKLFVSKNTVKTHIRKCYQKLGVSNRKEVLSELKKLASRKKEVIE